MRWIQILEIDFTAFQHQSGLLKKYGSVFRLANRKSAFIDLVGLAPGSLFSMNS
jgi:hypothetical protein